MESDARKLILNFLLPQFFNVMSMKNIVFISGIFGALLFIATSIMGGAQIEGYSFVGQYISESYAEGLPNVLYLRYLFILSGILLTIFGFLAPKFLPKSSLTVAGFSVFALFYGIGTVATSYFPCDFGCPSDNDISLSQFIHNISGFLTYTIIPVSLIVIGLSLKKNAKTKRLSKVSIISGLIAVVFVMLLFGNPGGNLIGLFQRIIESSILLWVIYTSFKIRSHGIKD